MSEFLFLCEICGTLLEERNCRPVCPNCGRTLDCSDLPALTADGSLEHSGDLDVFLPQTEIAFPPLPEPPAPFPESSG